MAFGEEEERGRGFAGLGNYGSRSSARKQRADSDSSGEGRAGGTSDGEDEDDFGGLNFDGSTARKRKPEALSFTAPHQQALPSSFAATAPRQAGVHDEDGDDASEMPTMMGLGAKFVAAPTASNAAGLALPKITPARASGDTSKLGQPSKRSKDASGKPQSKGEAMAARVLAKFGFKGRLGKNEQGIAEPIAVMPRPEGVGLGLVAEANSLPENRANTEHLERLRREAQEREQRLREAERQRRSIESMWRKDAFLETAAAAAVDAAAPSHEDELDAVMLAVRALEVAASRGVNKPCRYHAPTK